MEFHSCRRLRHALLVLRSVRPYRNYNERKNSWRIETRIVERGRGLWLGERGICFVNETGRDFFSLFLPSSRGQWVAIATEDDDGTANFACLVRLFLQSSSRIKERMGVKGKKWTPTNAIVFCMTSKRKSWPPAHIWNGHDWVLKYVAHAWCREEGAGRITLKPLGSLIVAHVSRKEHFNIKGFKVSADLGWSKHCERLPHSEFPELFPR